MIQHRWCQAAQHSIEFAIYFRIFQGDVDLDRESCMIFFSVPLSVSVKHYFDRQSSDQQSFYYTSAFLRIVSHKHLISKTHILLSRLCIAAQFFLQHDTRQLNHCAAASVTAKTVLLSPLFALFTGKRAYFSTQSSL